jgi:hypothetical protein
MENNYNKAHLADIFSKTQSYTTNFPGNYYKHSSTRMAEYTSLLEFDRRNIATGGVDMGIFPWEMHADTNERSLKTYTVSQVFQDLLYQLQNPRKVLLCGVDYSSTRVIQCCEDPAIHVTLLNTVLLDYFEKCVKTINSRFASLKYDVLNMQDLEAGWSGRYDLIEVWAHQIDMAFSDIDNYISLLEDGGMLLINCTSDWAYLYDNEGAGHPMYDLHEQLRLNDSVYTYHIPLHYGFTAVVKK